MNYYDVLGLKPTCSSDEIQTAYRRLAKQYHPDLGGDESKFHEISEAYDTLKNPHSRAAFDHKNARRQNIKINSENVFDDMFSVFGSAGFHPSKREYHKAQRNKNLGITVDLTLEELLFTQEKTISVRHLDGSRHIVNITIPIGVTKGTKIKYSGLGDFTHKKIPPGDLTVTINILEDNKFVKDNNNLKMDFTISAWDAIIGTVVNIDTIDKTKLNLSVPAGTQHGTVLKIPKHGLKDKKSNRGDLLVRILIKIPENLSEQQLNICKKLREEQ